MIGAWRYRNKVLHRMDFIFSSLGPSMAKMVLRTSFSHRWKEYLNSYFKDDVHVDEAAALAALVCLRSVISAVSPDDRALALHALQTGNRANTFANHLSSIQAGIALYGKDTIAKSAIYEINGALSGLSGNDLDDYRTRRLLEDAIGQISP